MTTRTVDTSAAAHLLGVTSRTIQRWAAAGVLVGWRGPKRGQWRFDAETVRRKRDKHDTSDTSDTAPVAR